jgi:hypothetical protein
MADLIIRVPLSNNDAEEYEEPINVHREAIAAAAFYIQPSTEGDDHDAVVGIERRNEDHLWLKDAFGSIDLCDLRRGNQGNNIDFLLDNEPPTPDNFYANERVSGKVVRETWSHTESLYLLKSIDYTRVGGKVTQEVRKVFGPDGTTVLGQLTLSYNRTGGRIVGATVDRNI